ncbi:MAG: spore germination protein, partial [Clostridia bacterium]
MVQDFVNGYALVFVGDSKQCVAVDLRIAQGRAVTTTFTSAVSKGPREGFTEDIKVNLALVRKRLKTEKLRTINLTVGKYTNTSVAICYLETIADISIVNNIAQTIKSINIDGITDSSQIARLLDKENTLMFRRVGDTEKPDVAVGKMLEGRIAVIVDGSPIVLTLPYMFIEDLQGPEDYFQNATTTSVSRALRAIAVVASAFLPSLYVSLQLYNYQIIPLKFLVTITKATQTIPFSPLSEMLLVLVLFDILREANMRMPSAAGFSLSLVGAIVLGDAAVNAGLLGAPAVVIGALSGIGLYTMPDNTVLLSIVRLFVTFLGGLMGLLGVILACLALLCYAVELGSYKTPYLAPYAPIIESDKQDSIMKSDLTKLSERPVAVSTENRTRFTEDK